MAAAAAVLCALFALLLEVQVSSALPPEFARLEGCVQSSQPYYVRCLPANFPSQTYLVAPDSEQNASTIRLSDIRDLARGNRLFWVLGGEYSIDNGVNVRNELYLARDAPVNADGTVAPNVVRCLPGHRCRLNVPSYQYGAGNWIWGLELADTRGEAVTTANAMVGLYGVGTGLINSFVHSNKRKSGLITRGTPTGATGLPQQEAVRVAGLPVHFTYGLFAMANGWGDTSGGKLGNVRIETNPEWGRTPVANSILLDESAVCDDCCAVWSADGSPTQSNGHNQYFRTFFQNGRVTIGDMGFPIFDTKFDRCVLENADAILFQRGRPFQATISANRFIRSAILDCEHQGQGNSTYNPSDPFVVTDNHFLQSPVDSTFYAGRRVSYSLRTGLVPAPSTLVGDTREGYPLRASDDFARNTFYGSFVLGLSAGNAAGYDGNANTCDQMTYYSDLTAWRSATSAAGKQLDATSRTAAAPSVSSVIVEPNEYEYERGHIVVENWGSDSALQVDVSLAVRAGRAFGIFAGRCPFDTPLVSSASYGGGPISLPVTGVDVDVFHILPLWSSQGAVQVRGEAHTPPTVVSSVSPSTGLPQSGGTVVVIRGTSFVCSDLLRARFGEFVVRATWISETEIQAVVPKQAGGNTANGLGGGRTVSVAVSNNCAGWTSGTNVTISYDSATSALPWNIEDVAAGSCDCSSAGRVASGPIQNGGVACIPTGSGTQQGSTQQGTLSSSTKGDDSSSFSAGQRAMVPSTLLLGLLAIPLLS